MRHTIAAVTQSGALQRTSEENLSICCGKACENSGGKNIVFRNESAMSIEIRIFFTLYCAAVVLT